MQMYLFIKTDYSVRDMFTAFNQYILKVSDKHIENTEEENLLGIWTEELTIEFDLDPEGDVCELGIIDFGLDVNMRVYVEIVWQSFEDMSKKLNILYRVLRTIMDENPGDLALVSQQDFIDLIRKDGMLYLNEMNEDMDFSIFAGLPQKSTGLPMII